MLNADFKTAWMSIDQADDPSHFVRLMDQARGGKGNDPAQYQTFAELLDVREGHRVLDVGCGTGGAAQFMAQRAGGSGNVIGFDNSKTMIAEAELRTRPLNLPVKFQQGDAHHLPFPDNSFDRCFALRFFEIIANPAQVLREMSRVTRPGGKIFVNGPDLDMWTFDVSDRDVTRQIVHYVCDHEVNGWIGRQLPDMFRDQGLAEMKVSTGTFFLNEFEMMQELYLKHFVGRACEAGVVSTSAATLWTEALKARCESGPFACSQSLFRVVGQKA
jgi:ubiquinone/menaquinone biosynthesis C-methylase UbiE